MIAFNQGVTWVGAGSRWCGRSLPRAALRSTRSLSLAALTCCVVPTFGAPQTTLHSFTGASKDPTGGLVQGYDNALWGVTTSFGGTVYRADAAGVRIMHSFTTLSEGYYPMFTLTKSSSGDLYGITWSGGDFSSGSAYRLSLTGDYSVVYHFRPTDGAASSALIEGADGNLYGTTGRGGTYGTGTFYRLTPTGVLTVLHSFSLNSDKGVPAGLLLASDGNFYGTTRNTPSMGGGLYRVTSSGVFTLLHAFSIAEGKTPGQLTQGSDGSLYGTSLTGGANSRGTIFKVATDGSVIVLASLDGSCADSLSVIQASDNFLYGTCRSGGSRSEGAIYRINPDGTDFTIVHSFRGAPRDGALPIGMIVEASDGNIYGITEDGGSNDRGSLWRLNLQNDR